VIGSSGNGEQIAANKIPAIRAALAFTRQTAQLPGSTTTPTCPPSARMYPGTQGPLAHIPGWRR
jgi:hypothetical protein